MTTTAIVRRFALVALLASSLAACVSPALAPAQTPEMDRLQSARLVAKTSLVSFPVTAAGETWTSAGILNVPYAGSGAPRPAIVIVHGSNGVDSRGAHYADALNRAGFVTLEIDLWAPRNVRSPVDRPRSVRDTLPDAFAALHFLTQQSADVDPTRIGIMGFSWGGVVSMLSATSANRNAFAFAQERFAAHAPFYPVCWVYNRVPGYEFRDLTGAPVLVQSGEADTYDEPHRCQTLRDSLTESDRQHVVMRSYPGATHAWDRREPDAVISDPYGHEGAGGETQLRFDAATTRSSTLAVVEFFSASLSQPTH